LLNNGSAEWRSRFGRVPGDEILQCLLVGALGVPGADGGDGERGDLTPIRTSGRNRDGKGTPLAALSEVSQAQAKLYCAGLGKKTREYLPARSRRYGSRHFEGKLQLLERIGMPFAPKHDEDLRQRTPQDPAGTKRIRWIPRRDWRRPIPERHLALEALAMRARPLHSRCWRSARFQPMEFTRATGRRYLSLTGPSRNLAPSPFRRFCFKKATMKGG
jgi:hypothetical protein